MKNTMLTAAILAAASLTASAQYGGGYTCAKDSPFYASLAGGYLFEIEEPYAVAHFGYEFSDCSSVALQVMHWGGEDEEDLAGLPFKLDLDVTSVGLTYKGYNEIGTGGGVYFTAGAGVAFFDAEGEYNGGKGSDDTTTFYIDASFGVQQAFSENVTGHIGVRAIYYDDFALEDQGVRLEGPLHDIYYGLEAGITIKF